MNIRVRYADISSLILGSFNLKSNHQKTIASTMQLFILSLALIAAVQCTAVYGSRAPDAPTALLDDYDETVQPDARVKVAVTAHVIRSYDYNEKDSDFKVDVHLIQYWKDSRFAKPSSSGSDEVTGGEQLRQAIWTPGTFFAKENGSEIELMVTPDVFVKINTSGDVFMSQRVIMKVICDPDIRKFPYDVRECNLTMEGNAYSAKSVEYLWKDVANPVHVEGSLTDFKLLSVKHIKDTIALDSGDTHDRLRVIFTYQRNDEGFSRYILLSNLATLGSLSGMLYFQNQSPKFRMLASTLFLVCNIVLYTQLIAASPRRGALTSADHYFTGNLIFVYLQFTLVGLATALVRDGMGKAMKTILELVDNIGSLVIFVFCLKFNATYFS